MYVLELICLYSMCTFECQCVDTSIENMTEHFDLLSCFNKNLKRRNHFLPIIANYNLNIFHDYMVISYIRIRVLHLILIYMLGNILTLLLHRPHPPY